MNINQIYIRRRNKVLVSTAPDIHSDSNSDLYVATAAKNLEQLGYTFSSELLETLRSLPSENIVRFYTSLIKDLKELRGDHVKHNPMYPNFPDEVMSMSDFELYLNAIVHYLTDGQYLPLKQKKERFPLIGNYNLTVLELGTVEDFKSLFTQLVTSNTSLSETDKTDVKWFLNVYGDRSSLIIPESIPNKENMAYIVGILAVNNPKLAVTYVKTATDVLRVAVALSGGDVSLAEKTKFEKMSRPLRRAIVSLLNSCGDITEDILRHKEAWKRLAHILHVGEFKQYPKVIKAFDILRNNKPFDSFNSVVEKALEKKDVDQAVSCLSHRPGDFARRLDHVLRSSNHLTSQRKTVKEFGKGAHKVSTPVLLQVREHFLHRSENNIRVAFPKGSVAKASALENKLPKLDDSVVADVIEVCEKALKERFKQLPYLGKVYLDPKLSGYNVPFSQRSASKSLRTLVRGSKVDIPDGDILRFFIWWKNGKERTDLDLSAVMLDENYLHRGTCSYYNLREFGGTHSGDIVDAPEGASEFIDISIDKCLERNIRFVVMTVNSFTVQPFCDLPECFAGWMSRKESASGEIYEPKTVQDKIDLTASTQVAIPIVFDLLDRKAIWCDLALKYNPNFPNNVASNHKGIALMVQSLVELNKPSVFDLLRIHTSARGTFVESPEEADTIFSTEDGIQYRLEEIASKYLV